MQTEHRHGHPNRLRPRRTRGCLEQDRVACRGGEAAPTGDLPPRAHLSRQRENYGRPRRRRRLGH